MSTGVEGYWRQYLASLPSSPKPDRYYEAFSFGTSKADADSIAELVISGTKTSTGSSAWGCEADGKTLPCEGDFSIVLNGSGQPVCIIETIEVRIRAFEEVDAQFAYEGGEGDRSLASWKAMYWDYLSSECTRIGKVPELSMPVVCERFRVVYTQPLAM